ncbi:MAG: hypothetical protein AVDCRST_MAG67-29 [uncultured Solirubrobacteraceae bacterium]|uniref:Uncharacterized protein n=1 Tax=uncultured Solirubrobacteraceae bacterium TaxID=1162706 RepID=A0A6J4RDL5_9ACTN|nr:MAG: hypothetical protein AVDCRST_MAG67-29 [uncultured Solirubrobacteraceae bacterium]
MSTHVEPRMLEAYAAGDVDAAHAFSIEAHVVECADCQSTISQAVSPARLARVWSDVEDRLDAPRAGPVEAVLTRIGVPGHLARLLAATPSLTLSWLAAVIVVLACGVLLAQQGERGLLVFLCVAALLPLAGVAAAFGRGLDPVYELAVAAPLSSVRLLLIRAAAVLSVTIALAGAAALTLPGLGWSAAAWLLPSLGLTVTSLALCTYVAPLTAFGTVSTAWIAVVLFGALASQDRLAAFGMGAQATFVLLACCATVVLVLRHDHLELGRTL